MRTVIFLFLLASFWSSNALAKSKPNIVYILVDNWGWGDIRIQGGSIPTPRIDALAQQGLRFTNFNVENQCTPTRSAIMTGRLPIRSGTHQVTYGLPYGMGPWEWKSGSEHRFC
jgi:arylsulfatase A-like enzyme